MPKREILVINSDPGALPHLRERHTDFVLQHGHALENQVPPDDVLFALVDFAVVGRPCRLPDWSRHTPTIICGAPSPGHPDATEAATETAFAVTSESLVNIDLSAWAACVECSCASAPAPEKLENVLAAVDHFSRRVLAAGTPAAIKQRLPLLLSTLIRFEAVAIWDWSADEIQVFCPAVWRAEQTRAAVEALRDAMVQAARSRALPQATTVLAFQLRGRAAPFDAGNAPIMATLGNKEGVMCVIRNSQAPFTESDARVFDLAANLVAHALHNARLIRSLEAQSRKIVEKNRQLAKASRLKSNFLANTSHELKTPLHSILGLAELLPEADSPEEVVHMSERIGVNGRRLMDLVTDLLDFSRLVADEEKVYPEPFDVEKFTQGLVDAFADLTRVKAVAFRWTNDAGDAKFSTDREKAFRIVANLLSNAIKFTPEGEVSLRLGREDDDLIVSVSDTGVGIPSEHLERIFEQFHRIKGPLQDTAEGAGLGLAIAQRLAQLLGGNIVVSSEVGVGSVFTLRLPPVKTGLSSAPAALPYLGDEANK